MQGVRPEACKGGAGEEDTCCNICDSHHKDYREIGARGDEPQQQTYSVGWRGHGGPVNNGAV